MGDFYYPIKNEDGVYEWRIIFIIRSQMVCGKCWKEYSESDLIKVSDEEFVFYQYPNANHAAAIDFEAYFSFFFGRE